MYTCVTTYVYHVSNDELSYESAGTQEREGLCCGISEHCAK